MPVETIAALATPAGVGAIGVIRISGPDTFRIGRLLGALDSGPVEAARARVRQLREDGELLDQVLALPFVGPASFTGEDVLELHCHGGETNIRRLLDAIWRAGARVAEPGEFSRRALLNNKLDVVQVEAIADIIHAESEAGLRLAQSHLAGRLSTAIDTLKESLATLMVLVESAIDFSLEEHIYSIEPAEIVEGLAPVLAGIDELLATYDAGRLRSSGVRIAIVGAPNAGKSTLLNALLREDRAIVTSIPGTTRDTIEGSLEVEGIRFHLIDTAGIRESDEPVERLGIERAHAAIRSADATLAVVALDDLASARAAMDELRSPWGLLLNKLDQAPTVRAGDEAVAQASTFAPTAPVASWQVSLQEQGSPEDLEVALLTLAEAAGFRRGTDSVLLSRARHRELLEDSRESLERAREAAEAGLGHELVALDLRSGLDALGALTGAITRDDVLNRIFAGFCIGK